jgi:hypothetical protein
MRELEKKLKNLESQGYETISIAQVLKWMRDIQSDARIKRLGLND